jgi:hypothetical protein
VANAFAITGTATRAVKISEGGSSWLRTRIRPSTRRGSAPTRSSIAFERCGARPEAAVALRKLEESGPEVLRARELTAEIGASTQALYHAVTEGLRKHAGLRASVAGAANSSPEARSTMNVTALDGRRRIAQSLSCSGGWTVSNKPVG